MNTKILAAILCLSCGFYTVPAAASLQVFRQAGGEPGAVVVQDAYFYLAQGPAIVVTNHDGAQPSPQFVTPPLAGKISGLAELGGFLYAAVRTDEPNGLLAVFSLEEPSRPRLVAVEDYSNSAFSSPTSLIAVGGRLYLADEEIGLLVVDVTIPADPGFTIGVSGGINAQAMTLSQGRLVTWGRSALGQMVVQLFDLTQPTSPTSLGGFSAGLALGGAVHGNFFFGIGFGLEIYDFSNLNQVQLVFQDGNAESRSVLVEGNQLLFGNADGLHVWNVTNPAQATETAVIPAAMDRTHVAVAMPMGQNVRLAFFSEMGRGFVFAPGSSPTLLHTWDLPGGVDTTAVAMAGDRTFTSDFYSGLRVLAAESLLAVGRLDAPAGQQGAFEGLKVVGSRVYLANWGYGLLIVDVANPAAPSLLGQVEIAFATAVEVVGNVAYVVTSTNGGFLVVVDIANPANPQILNVLPTVKSLDIVHHAGLLLVADEALGDPGGLRLFQLAQPHLPSLVGHYQGCDSAAGVAAQGSVAFVACHDGSLHVVDLTNPANPQQLGVYSDPSVIGQGSDVVVEGTTVVFAQGTLLHRLQVANPSSPQLAERLELGVSPRRVEKTPQGQVWLAAGTAGVYRVELGVFEDGFESGDTSTWSATSP